MTKGNKLHFFVVYFYKVKFQLRFDLHNGYFVKEGLFYSFIHSDLFFCLFQWPYCFTIVSFFLSLLSVFTYFEIIDRAINLIKNEKDRVQGLSS